MDDYIEDDDDNDQGKHVNDDEYGDDDILECFCEYIDQDDKYDDNADDDYCSSHHEVDGVFAEVFGDVGEYRHLTNVHSLKSETNHFVFQSKVCLRAE